MSDDMSIGPVSDICTDPNNYDESKRNYNLDPADIIKALSFDECVSFSEIQNTLQSNYPGLTEDDICPPLMEMVNNGDVVVDETIDWNDDGKEVSVRCYQLAADQDQWISKEWTKRSPSDKFSQNSE